MKKPSQRRTELDRLVAKLRTALRRETKNVIEIGKLLNESREHLKHGGWQHWLAENFDLSLRTAQNYCAAAEYVARKSATVADFANLSPTVLYRLAAGRFNEQEEAAILAASREHRVDSERAHEITLEIWQAFNLAEIWQALNPADDDDAGDADHQDDGGRDDGGGDDPEISAILDGPPPDVPPPAQPPPRPDFDLCDFNTAIDTLKRLRSKLLQQFIGSTAHTVDDLENVESFLREVRNARKSADGKQPGSSQREALR